MTLSKDNTKLVSIILPTYNREKYIKRAINSIINQSYNNWELIIIDDGSTDRTKDIVNTHKELQTNIKYFFHSNRGVALSMNMGIKVASGDYITFLGSDDEYLPDHLKLRLDFLSTHQEIDLIHSRAIIVGSKYVKDKNDLNLKIHLDDCIIGGTLFGKKEVFDRLKGFKKVGYSPESDFIERAKDIFSIVKIDMLTYKYYRDTPDSICNNI